MLVMWPVISCGQWTLTGGPAPRTIHTSCPPDWSISIQSGSWCALGQRLDNHRRNKKWFCLIGIGKVCINFFDCKTHAKSHHLWELLLSFVPDCPDSVEVNIAEDPQATYFKDAEHMASSWTIKAYQSFRRVQTAGWWPARCVPLQAGLHFKVTRLNLIQYHLQNEITLCAIKKPAASTAANCRLNNKHAMWLTLNEAVWFRQRWSSHTGPVMVSVVSQQLVNGERGSTMTTTAPTRSTVQIWGQEVSFEIWKFQPSFSWPLRVWNNGSKVPSWVMGTLGNKTSPW